MKTQGKRSKKVGEAFPSVIGHSLLWPSLALVFAFSADAKNLFLVSSLDGEGALIQAADGVRPAERSRFLPHGERISVRPRGGVETLAAGRTLRFGSGTSFILKEDSLVLEQGSLLYRASKPGKTLALEGPEASIILEGAGTLMAEVEPNGGFKLVGLLGRTSVTGLEKGRRMDVLPGELLFVKPGSRGFGDKVNVNLSKLMESSYLVGGFRNMSSFSNSLQATAKAQQQSIAARVRAEVGRAKGPDTFEILPSPSANPPEISAPTPAVRPVTSSSVSRGSALSELLGREPSPIPRSPVAARPSPPSTPPPPVVEPSPLLPPLEPAEPPAPLAPVPTARPLVAPPAPSFPAPPPSPFDASRAESSTGSVEPNFSAPVKPQPLGVEVTEPAPSPFPFAPPAVPVPEASPPPPSESDPLRPLPGRLFRDP